MLPAASLMNHQAAVSQNMALRIVGDQRACQLARPSWRESLVQPLCVLQVRWFEQQTLRRRVKRSLVVPSDPWFSKQWYMVSTWTGWDGQGGPS